MKRLSSLSKSEGLIMKAKEFANSIPKTLKRLGNDLSAMYLEINEVNKLRNSPR